MFIRRDLNFVDYHIEIKKDIFIRIFSEDIEDIHFEWHRDKEDRTIKVLYSDDEWKFQYDDQLPFILKEGMEFKVKKDFFHKLHKGKGVLIIYVKQTIENLL